MDLSHPHHAWWLTMIISKHTTFSSSCDCQLSHQSTNQIYKYSIKVVSHIRSHLHFLACLIILCLPALNLPLKQSQLLMCWLRSYLGSLWLDLARSFPEKSGFSFQNSEPSKRICSLSSTTLPSLHINMNKSHTENQAKFTGTLSLTLPAKLVRVGLQNNHTKLHQRYVFHWKAASFTWKMKSLRSGKAQNSQTHST